MRRSISSCIVVMMLAMTVSGCSRRVMSPVLTHAPAVIDLPPFTRVLVAGFVSKPLEGVDANAETSRLLRRDLRQEMSLDVLNTEPLHLQLNTLEDVPYWRRLGEEYREPLIVTGVVDFKSAGRWYEERQVGRRTMRIWLPQYSLAVRLLLIDGKTGRRIDSAACGPRVAHATTARERALNLYFRLIDQTRPSMLAVFGRRTAFRSGSGPPCRREEVEVR